MIVRKDIQQLLQECLDGYDAGLTPEECLSAYPRVRAELEPLFRQGISLRVAYAASPRAEFKFQAREKLLFAAGRDVTQALSVEPDPEFVETTRRRLLNRAGARAQEALRDVPPPRLPFWANARRRLLETAAATPPKPSQRMPAGMRYALSAAVIVLAVAIAGGGFLLQNSPANRPAATAVTVSTQLDELTQGVATAEQMRASGQVVASSLLEDLATRTSKLVEQYSPNNPNAELLQKLPDLIERQQTLLAEETSLDETLSAAQERLEEADQTLSSAAIVESSQSPAASTPEPTTSPTKVPTLEVTEEPDLSVLDIEPVDQSTLSAGQVVQQIDPTIDLLGLNWLRVTTRTLTFVMPDTWVITNLSTGADGVTVLTPPEALFVKTDVAGISLVIFNQTGKIDTVIDGVQYTLRPAGANASPIDASTLLQLVNLDPSAAALFNMLSSVEVSTGEPAATATPESTSTPEVTATPATPTTEDPVVDATQAP